MSRIKVLIVDDERSAREEIKRMLQQYTQFEIIGEAANAEDARSLIEKMQPELLFLDIQMPEESGFELLESLDKVPGVIFTTAFDQYALQAFEVNALDYLMKPIREERFAKAVLQVAQQIGRNTEPRVCISDRNQIFLFRWSEVFLIESMDNYARIYFGDKKIFLKSSLNRLEAKLDPQLFFRANRAQLINLQFIHTIDTLKDGKMMVILPNEQIITISSRRALKFRNKLRN
ncbi:MAG: response regulator [Bacteroidota bacterium]